MKTQPETLQSCWDHLTQTEMAILTRVIKLNKEYEYIHQGMLPFLKRDIVLKWLTAYVGIYEEHSFGTHTRPLIKILEKIKGKKRGYQFILKVNSGLVRRRFGSNPERGVLIPGLPTFKVWRERIPFERTAKPIETNTHYPTPLKIHKPKRPTQKAFDIKHRTVRLEEIYRDKWAVSCDPEVQLYIGNWLKTNLGVW